MNDKEKLSCLTDRPCTACKFHKEEGCSKWSCIFEEKSGVSEREKGEWIPVSERLPDNNVRVLCSAISTSISGGYTRFVGCCDNGFWFVQTDAETVSYPRQYKVTAWMPLPETYKAESEDKK